MNTRDYVHRFFHGDRTVGPELRAEIRRIEEAEAQGPFVIKCRNRGPCGQLGWTWLAQYSDAPGWPNPWCFFSPNSKDALVYKARERAEEVLVNVRKAGWGSAFVAVQKPYGDVWDDYE